MNIELLDKQAVLKAIDDEPEYPGKPPLLMETIRNILELDPENHEAGILIIVRMAVNQTKGCIAKRVKGLNITKMTGKK